MNIEIKTPLIDLEKKYSILVSLHCYLSTFEDLFVD